MRISSRWLLAAVLASSLLGDSLKGVRGARAAGCYAETFHDERHEGSVCCFVDHFHYGESGPGYGSRGRALQAAIDSWADFVDLEYGSYYSHWSLAHAKAEDCNNSGGWSCQVSARPCHSG
jgi:hypothetical protein